MKRSYIQPASFIEAIGTTGLLQMALPTTDGNGDGNHYAPSRQYSPSQQYKK